ncbi:Uncharacterised protein [Sphingobacterium multivorum]|uniref:Carboxypeptidase regulatory-like domain-containing protein n=1 Tax=Sphingobacterium multivorum TaxID=28454 RepID=A0A2X2JQ77_SPHMU|nr:carboxypeptidase-like regulatory domain-containing protein [Sphingobacterium multivorum]SPZ94196.1 Uncharacterised protein [Sphingobacterium multivorum]
MRKHLITSILLSTIGTSLTYAQNETTSALNGTVREGNSPINGATIEAIHLPSGTKYVTSSRSDGRYNLPNMRIGGPYQITVTYLGAFTQYQADRETGFGTKLNIRYSDAVRIASIG